MAHLTPEALEHFETHNGVASAAQLTELGVTREAVKKLRRQGLLELVLDGAYRLRGQPMTMLARCTAVCIAHPGHVIGGPTAGRIYGLRRLPGDARIHTISPPCSNPTVAPWVKPYRTAAINSDDVVTRPDGIAITTLPRTALDLARFLRDGELLSVIEQAMRDGRHSDAEMRRVAADWVSPRRPWLRRFLWLLDRRLDGGHADSHHEVVLGDALAAAGVTGLVRQYPIDLPGYGRAYFDLAVPQLRWAIEVDVFPTHLETAGRASDRRRDAGAVELGWSVTRVDAEGFGPALSATVDRLVRTHRTLIAKRRALAHHRTGER